VVDTVLFKNLSSGKLFGVALIKIFGVQIYPVDFTGVKFLEPV
jgi:hypothetical protein